MKEYNLTKIIVDDYLKYLGQRDLDNILKLFSDEIDWYIPGNENDIPWLGKRSTKKEISNFFTLLWSNTESISAMINNIAYDDSNAIIVGQFSTRMLRTNNIVNSIFFIHIVVEKQQITKYWLLEDSYAISKSLNIT